MISLLQKTRVLYTNTEKKHFSVTRKWLINCTLLWLWFVSLHYDVFIILTFWFLWAFWLTDYFKGYIRLKIHTSYIYCLCTTINLHYVYEKYGLIITLFVYRDTESRLLIFWLWVRRSTCAVRSDIVIEYWKISYRAFMQLAYNACNHSWGSRRWLCTISADKILGLGFCGENCFDDGS